MTAAHHLPQDPALHGKVVSEKEELARLIKNYIVHSEKIAEASHLTHYHNLAWATHMDSVRMLKIICRDIKQHTLAELTLFAFNGMAHLEALLPAASNRSYESSNQKLYEIKILLQNAANKLRK